MGLKLVTGPSSEPVSIDDAKLWLRLDDDTPELDIVEGLIAAARQALDGADGYLGRALATQTWKLILDTFPHCGPIDIPLPPLQSITSVKYRDTAGTQQTLATTVYGVTFDDWNGSVYLKSGQSWPAILCEPAAVEIEFVAGYADGIPYGLRYEILGLIGSWFDNRPMAGKLPDGWSSQYRRIPVG